jgi:predicted deacetylase
MGARYLVRLDDACPTMDAERWAAVEALLRGRGVSPIVAVVPANADPDLVRGSADGSFWERARSWAALGWVIALHGYSHSLRPSPRGLVPVNAYSEFVGLSEEEQRRRIREGVAVLAAQGLEPAVWVAPAHGFDEATLASLRDESRVRIVSDGFTRRAVLRGDFVWLPQQLWRPRKMGGGLWTICLHPNTLSEPALGKLARFIDENREAFVHPLEAARGAAQYGPADAAHAAAFAAALSLRKTVGAAARAAKGNRA